MVLASTPDSERSPLDQEFVSSNKAALMQRTVDCDNFLTQEKAKWTNQHDIEALQNEHGFLLS